MLGKVLYSFTKPINSQEPAYSDNMAFNNRDIMTKWLRVVFNSKIVLSFIKNLMCTSYLEKNVIVLLI